MNIQTKAVVFDTLVAANRELIAKLPVANTVNIRTWNPAKLDYDYVVPTADELLAGKITFR